MSEVKLDGNAIYKKILKIQNTLDKVSKLLKLKKTKLLCLQMIMIRKNKKNFCNKITKFFVLKDRLK
jgi:hypothetical protein